MTPKGREDFEGYSQFIQDPRRIKKQRILGFFTSDPLARKTCPDPCIRLPLNGLETFVPKDRTCAGFFDEGRKNLECIPFPQNEP